MLALKANLCLRSQPSLAQSDLVDDEQILLTSFLVAIYVERATALADRHYFDPVYVYVSRLIDRP